MGWKISRKKKKSLGNLYIDINSELIVLPHHIGLFYDNGIVQTIDVDETESFDLEVKTYKTLIRKMAR